MNAYNNLGGRFFQVMEVSSAWELVIDYIITQKLQRGN